VPFSLGAGSGKQMQKPLGAHQERILIAMKENTAVLIYRPNYKQFIVSCVGKFDILHQSHQFIIRLVSLLSFVNSHYFAERKRKNLAPNKRTNFLLVKRRNF
jgi:fructose-1,6-bisphosphatase